MSCSMEAESFTEADMMSSSSSSSSDGRFKKWRDGEVESLLALWGEPSVQHTLIAIYRKNHLNRALYEDISRGMAEQGFTRSWQQCQRKVKDLKNTYRKIKDGNKRGAAAPRRIDGYQFYELLDVILGDKKKKPPPLNNDDSERDDDATDDAVLVDTENTGVGLLTPPGPLYPCCLRAFSHSQEDGLLQHVLQEHSIGEPGAAAADKHRDLLHTPNLETPPTWAEHPGERESQPETSARPDRSPSARIARRAVVESKQKDSSSMAGSFTEEETWSSSLFKKWKDGEVQCLLSLWEDASMQDTLLGKGRRSKLKKSLYEDISRGMAEQGFTRSWRRCQRKVKDLKNTYRKIKDASGDKSRAGAAGRIDGSQFYEQLDAILCDKKKRPSVARPSPPNNVDGEREEDTTDDAAVIDTENSGVGRLAAADTHLDLLHARVAAGGQPYVCERCGRGFWLPAALQAHVRAAHDKDGPRRRACHVCGKTFTRQSHRRHVLTHSGERNHLCAQCVKAFLTSGELMLHTRTHTGERPYSCQLCGKGFVRKVFLTVHIRTHSGERPFACTLCPGTFTARKYLKRHMLGHSDKRPFQCVVCGSGFVESCDLRRHLRKANCKKK